jgi:bacterioferritin-associated ferredoxin
MIICLCRGINDKQIKTAINNGAKKMSDLNKTLGVCSQCGKCGQQAQQLLKANASGARENQK